MKEKMKTMLQETIKTWTAEDIYAISIWLQYDNYNPCKPVVIVGYNTEEQYQKSLQETDEREARWNFAFWLQNEELCFGVDETAEDVRQWIIANGYSVFEDDDDVEDAQCEAMERFIENTLIEIVKEVHQKKILTEQFGEELPIIIHELEYYDKIAENNMEANGDILDEGFVDFCIGG